MSELVSQFLNDTGTYLILGASDITPQGRDSRQLLPCPSCGHAAYIVGSAIVCSGKNCSWRVGTAVDYVGTVKGQTTRQVLKNLRESCPHKTETIAGTPWFETIDKLVHVMERQQELRQFLISKRGSAKIATPEMAAAESWLNQNGVSLHNTQSTLYLLTARECRELSQRITALTGRAVEDWPHACGAIVTPFLSDFLTISHLLLSPLHPHPTSSKPVFWNVTPTRTSFSGLWECRNGVLNNARFLNSPMIAAALRERQSDLQTSPLYLGLVTTAGITAETSLRFDRAVYLMRRGAETLKSMMNLKLLVNPGGLSAGYVNAPASIAPWLEFLANRWDHFLRVENNREAVKCDIQHLVLTTKERTDWKNYLDKHGYTQISEYMQSAAGTTQRTHTVRGAVIFETDAGYRVQAGKTPAEICTNFTVELLRNISFPGSDDLYHQAVMHYQGVGYPTLLKNSMLMKLPDFKRAMNLAYSNTDKLSGTPSVFVNKLATFLPQMFSQQIAVLPRIQGTKSLGWSSDRQQFVAPQWCVNANEITYRETCGDPYLMVLRNYDFSQTEQPSGMPNDPPAWAGELLAILVGQAARVQRGRIVQPVVFRDTQTTREALTDVFERAFGQKSLVMFNQNYRGFRDIDLLGGYPCLATGSLPNHVIAKGGVPFVLLADTGRIFDVEESSLDAGIQFLTAAYPKVVAWLAKTSAASVVFQQSLLYEQDMLQDGLSILEKSIGYKWSGTLSDTPILDAVLQTLPFSQLPTVFRQCFSSQRLLIQLGTELKQFQPTLWVELAKEDQTFSPGDIASMDLLTGLNLLKEFYREVPKLPEVKTAKPTPEEWVSSAVDFRRASPS